MVLMPCRWHGFWRDDHFELLFYERRWSNRILNSYLNIRVYSHIMISGKLVTTYSTMLIGIKPRLILICIGLSFSLCELNIQHRPSPPFRIKSCFTKRLKVQLRVE